MCTLNLPWCLFSFCVSVHIRNATQPKPISNYDFFCYRYCFLSQCKSNQKLPLLGYHPSLFRGIGLILAGVRIVDWMLRLCLLFQPVSDMHFYQYVLRNKQYSVKSSQLRQDRSQMWAVALSHNTHLGIFQLTDARRWQFVGGMAFLWECFIWTDKWGTFQVKEEILIKGNNQYPSTRAVLWSLGLKTCHLQEFSTRTDAKSCLWDRATCCIGAGWVGGSLSGQDLGFPGSNALNMSWCVLSQCWKLIEYWPALARL